MIQISVFACFKGHSAVSGRRAWERKVAIERIKAQAIAEYQKTLKKCSCNS